MNFTAYSRLFLMLIVCGYAIKSFAQVGPCDATLAEREKYKVSKLVFEGIPSNLLQNPITGQLFSNELLAKLKSDVEAELQKKTQARFTTSSGATGTAASSFAPRFEFHVVATTCEKMDTGQKTVGIRVRSDNFVIPQGDTASRVLDEEDRGHVADFSSDKRVELRANRDPLMGTLVGANILTHTIDRETTSWDRWYFGGYSNLKRDFYHGALSFETTIGRSENSKSLEPVVLSLWNDRLPLANLTTLSKGVRFGFGWAGYTGAANTTLHFVYRFTETNVNGPAGSIPHQGEHAGEWSWQTDLPTDGGFLRFGSFGDAGKASKSPGDYVRTAFYLRSYQSLRLSEHQSFTIDLVGSAGISGGTVPIYRQFVGGNRYDPFLADQFHPSDEYTWFGPVYRAVGVASFYGKPGPFQDNVSGGTFSGLSITLGIPGFSEPHMRALSAREKTDVETKISQALDITGAQFLDSNLRKGASPEQARKLGYREVQELSKALHNLVFHASRLSIRPLFAADLARITGAGATSRTGFCVGTGLRIETVNHGVEALYMESISDTGTSRLHQPSLVARLYFRPGSNH